MSLRSRLRCALMAAALCPACGEGVHGWEGASSVRARIGPEGGQAALSWVTVSLEPNAVADAVDLVLRASSPTRRGAVGPAVDVRVAGSPLKLAPQAVVRSPVSETPERLALAYLEPPRPGADPAPQWVPFATTYDPSARALLARLNGFDQALPAITLAPVLKCATDGHTPCPEDRPDCRAGVCQ